MEVQTPNTENMGCAAELPRYKSHKVVHALKIKEIKLIRPTVAELERILNEESDTTDAGALLTPEEKGYAPFHVNQQYVNKHDPQVGGYYVVYSDGYQSWSPAQAFEEGYTLC